MSVIKSEHVNYQQHPQPLFVTIRIPVIDTFHSAPAKIEKLKEELDELLAEACCAPVDDAKLMEEMHDVLQVIAGYVLARSQERLAPEVAYKLVPAYFTLEGRKHLNKMEQRAVERGGQLELSL